MTFYCPICGKQYEYLYKLKYHYRKCHKSDYCPLCKKEFKSVVKHAIKYYIAYNCKYHATLAYLLHRVEGRDNSPIHSEIAEIALEVLKQKLRW